MAIDITTVRQWHLIAVAIFMAGVAWATYGADISANTEHRKKGVELTKQIAALNTEVTVLQVETAHIKEGMNRIEMQQTEILRLVRKGAP